MQHWESLFDQLRVEFLLRDQELSLLHEIDMRIISTEPTLRTAFPFITGRTRDLVDAYHVQILLQRGAWLESTYSSAEVDDGQRVRIDDSITGRCFSENQVVMVHDLDQPPYDSMYIPIKGFNVPMRSLMCVPIRIGDRPVGVLSAESDRPAAFREAHADAMVKVGAQVAVALQRLQLFDTEALSRRLERHLRAVEETGPTDPVQAALEDVMQALREQHVDLSGAQILFVRGDEELEIVYSTSPSYVGLSLPMQESICGRAVRERRTVVVGDVDEDRDYRRTLGPAIQSEIAVPIRLGGDDGLVIGVLNVVSEEPDAFTGFYELVLNNFATKVTTLLAFAKLRGDVTEALEVRGANDLLVAVGDQTSNMIHRLNNTVGAMRFRIRQLQSMQDTGTLAVDDRLREMLATLLELADRTLKMPDEVTSFLGREGNMVDVNDCVRRIVRDLNIADFITVDLSLDGNVPRLPLFSFDIVVSNLIRNAIDALPNGGTLTVSTSAVSLPELAGGYVELVVRDSGIGIPENILNQIFELNFTTKREREGKGLGLGLWWVRTFVRRAKGEITIRSTQGEGTAVMVKIPFSGADADIADSTVSV
jgi:GAF domain-containing protein